MARIPIATRESVPDGQQAAFDEWCRGPGLFHIMARGP